MPEQSPPSAADHTSGPVPAPLTAPPAAPDRTAPSVPPASPTPPVPPVPSGAPDGPLPDGARSMAAHPAPAPAEHSAPAPAEHRAPAAAVFPDASAGPFAGPPPDRSAAPFPPVPESFDRSGTDSVKWATAGADHDPYRIPLGVADMDLPGFPALFEALRERVRHPVIGYTLPSARGRDLVVAWYRDRFGAVIDPDWIVQLPFGPRTAIRFVLDAVAARSDRPGPVLATGPEYGGFPVVAGAAGLRYEEIPLRRAPDGYRLPVEEFESRAARSGATAVVLSSPHNPTGRIWSPAEINRLAAAAASGGGVLVSDEVHSDLVHPGSPPHPVAVHAVDPGLAARTVTLHSVGKGFNVSGIAEVLLLVPSPDLRQRLIREIEGHGFSACAGPLAALAQDIAFDRGGPWRDGLVEYLAGNRDLAVRVLRQAVPGLVACVPEASYLLWLDAGALAGARFRGGRPRNLGDSGLSRSPDAPGDVRGSLLRSCGLDLQDGGAFGGTGQGFLRLNFALPRPRLREAVTRLARYAAGS